jgi:lysozyme family protein
MKYPANFEKSVAIILENEGGYVNNPKDPGGETKYGISKRSYPNLDIKNLTIDQAKDIYYRDFWLPIQADSIIDERLAVHYFDMAVNAGRSRAVRLLEKITGQGITGTISKDTLIKANLIPDAPARYVQARKDYYHNITLINPKNNAFIKGWMNRVDHVEKKNA